LNERTTLSTTTCEACGGATPDDDVVHYGSNDGVDRLLCTSCFNMEVAARAGLTHFENVRLKPVAVSDCDGIPHLFHFRVRLLGNLLSLDMTPKRENRMSNAPSGSSALLALATWNRAGVPCGASARARPISDSDISTPSTCPDPADFSES